MAKAVNITFNAEMQGAPSPFPWKGKGMSLDEGPTYDYELTTGSTDDATIGLGGLTTITFLLITSNQTVTIKYNGSSTAQTLTADGAHLFFDTSMTTAPTVSNSSGSTANIRCWLGGT